MQGGGAGVVPTSHHHHHHHHTLASLPSYAGGPLPPLSKGPTDPPSVPTPELDLGPADSAGAGGGAAGYMTEKPAGAAVGGGVGNLSYKSYNHQFQVL